MGKSQNQKPRGNPRSSEHQRAVEERRRSGAAGPHVSTRDRKTIKREQQEELEEFGNWREYQDGRIPDIDDDDEYGTWLDSGKYGYR